MIQKEQNQLLELFKELLDEHESLLFDNCPCDNMQDAEEFVYTDKLAKKCRDFIAKYSGEKNG
jgi:hypothetical protein